MTISIDLLNSIAEAASAAGGAHLSMRLSLSDWKPSDTPFSLQDVVWHPHVTDEMKEVHAGLIIQERRLWDFHDVLSGKNDLAIQLTP